MNGEINNCGTRYGVLRRAQFITPFGVGSIVDFPDESLMPASIDLWPNTVGVKIYDERLQKRLGVSYFKMVPSAEEYKNGIPFYRFPKWLFCPSCRSLRHISDWQNRFKKVSKNGQPARIPKCDTCRVKLVPSRFITVCEKGHIDDFPWIYWVHGDDVCSNPDLTISTGGGTSGLVGINIKCKTCNKTKTMAGAFSEDALKGFKCTGFKPWVNKAENCDVKPPKTVQRGASNVYFPKIVSSIVIPPYSDDLISEIQRTDGFNFLKEQEGLLEDPDDIFFKEACKKIAKSIGRDSETVTSAIIRLLNPKVTDCENQKETDYRYDEYRAFLGDIDEGSVNSKDFRIEIRGGNEYTIPGVDKVVLVHRLREVRCLMAFSRLNPLDRNQIDFEDEENQVRAYGVPVKENRNINWLPAIEVRGEGIFLTFKNSVIEAWVNNTPGIETRAQILNNRFNEYAKQFNRELRVITPKFIFLHTLAHILIRQLSFECGYGSASLRERIYCNEDSNGTDMAGILIYTASGDSEGTLGGLVRQAKPQFFNSIVEKAVKNAAWCSSDPLCFESTGQGMNSLNLAACHACVLLPETSCEELNRFLDRALVVGLPGRPELGFMANLIHH